MMKKADKNMISESNENTRLHNRSNGNTSSDLFHSESNMENPDNEYQVHCFANRNCKFS